MADGTLLVQVPADDGTIQRAFETLDAQMDAWLTAMHRAERALSAGVAKAAVENASVAPAISDAQTIVGSVEVVDSAGPADSTGPLCAVEQEDIPAATVVVSPEVVEEAEPVVEVPAEASQPTVEEALPGLPNPPVAETSQDIPATPMVPVAADIPDAPDAAASDIAESVAEASTEPSAEPTVEPTVSPAAQRAAEDEALLASLDEETVKAIRVMRRMCMNQKSVKELLAEYQAKKGNQSAAAAAAKKSWFRRGK